jgi:hypothetical protein
MTIDPAAADVALIALALIAAFWIVGKIVSYLGNLWRGIYPEE